MIMQTLIYLPNKMIFAINIRIGNIKNVQNKLYETCEVYSLLCEQNQENIL